MKEGIKYHFVSRFLVSVLFSVITFLLIEHEVVWKIVCTRFLSVFLFWEAHYRLLLFIYKKGLLMKVQHQISLLFAFSVLYFSGLIGVLFWQGDLAIHYYELFVFLLFVMCINAIHFLFASLRQYNFHVHRELREKKLVLEEKYKAIKSKTVLQFLKSSLQATQKLITLDPDKALVQIETLTAMLRSLLQSRDKDFISLKEESDLVEEFIQLLELQGNVKIVYSIEHDPAYFEHRIPPFVLILIFDNIFLNRSFIPYAELQVYVENGIYLVAKYKQLRKTNIAQKQADLMRNLKQRYSFTNQDTNVVRIVTQTHTYIKVPLLKPVDGQL